MQMTPASVAAESCDNHFIHFIPTTSAATYCTTRSLCRHCCKPPVNSTDQPAVQASPNCRAEDTQDTDNLWWTSCTPRPPKTRSPTSPTLCCTLIGYCDFYTDPVLRSACTDGWALWVNRPLQVSQLGQLSLSSFRGRQMSSRPVYRMCGAIWWMFAR